MKLFAFLPFLAPLVSAAAISSAEKPITYDGYKVFRIDTHGRARGAVIEKMLQGLKAVQYNYDTDTNIEIAVAPEDLGKFERMRLDFEVLDEDLGASIRAEGGFHPGGEQRFASSLNQLRPGAFPDESWFRAYHSFNDHQQWLVDIQAGFPENSELIEVGKSFEGRIITALHLWGKDGKDAHKAVYWHGTVHAREWISTMVVEYNTYQIITNYLKNDTTITKVLDSYDFYILPVVNPDGFAHTQTGDRLWRKNRLKHPSSSCIGTDMNRNWPYKWETTGGSSTSPCSETFRGLSAGNTDEITALVKFSEKLAAKNGIKSYIDWHSFSQLILLPYGYSCNEHVPNYERQMELARGVASAIKQVRKTTFTPGETCPDLYKAVGGSTDWMQDVGKAEISWCIELHPSGGGANGFILPASQIEPAAKDLWAGMLYLLPTM
ncbi:hypothetical protein TWF696_006731 [Orbilia brochopaga]|uniref:Carboxypeptidase M14A n=1 Tax=Orbilia brochopaga TaxID=3140254 RepID=A0AAV9UVZ2_9PEZI